MKKALMASTLLLAVFGLTAFSGAAFAERIICASTTSTQNSGLFEYLLPIFQEKTGIEVQVVAVGTGAALEIGKRGDADVVFVHARDLELQMVREGHFVGRRDVMYNDFVIIGPKDDPLGLKSSAQAAEAFRKIAEAPHPFVSRGDDSGTHRKELALWKAAGVQPSGDWYMEVGQGMAKTQRIAAEKRAYTLTDRGTWLSRKDELDMAIAFEGDPAMFNQYGAMAVNPERHAHVKYKEAMVFINWLVSPEGQKAIGDFKDQNGNSLFVPNASK
ncbi:MAG: extracellular solute-binding protein [Thermodesulfovibrionales bacterium]